MRKSTRILYATTLLALGSTGLLPDLAAADPPLVVAESDKSDQWQFAASVYGWFASVGGTVNFPVTGTSTSFKVDAKTLLNNFQLGGAGTFDVHKGHWGVFTDVMYMDLGGGKSNTRDFTLGNTPIPATTTADLHLTVKAWIWTIAGEYRVVADPAWTVDLLAGARYLDLSETLNWTITGALGPLPPIERAGTAAAGGHIWDAIVGVKGRYAFGAEGKWSIPFYLDGGAGDSEYTYQALLGVGYSFRWGEVAAAWRYLGYSAQSGHRISDFYFSGPLIGAVFRW
jgi:hypothetical protein